MPKTHLRPFALLLVILMILGSFAACRRESPSAELPVITSEPNIGLATYQTSLSETEKPAERTDAPHGTPTPAAAAQPTPTAKPTAEITNAPTLMPNPTAEPTKSPSVSEDGEYDSRDEVALYIHLFGHLPSNYITKSEAQKLGWSGGSLERYAPGCSIGGDRFGNYESLLPVKQGRKYYECDIDTKGRSSRGAKRIVFSNDGLIYYTDDHYDSFTLLYGGK